MLTTLKPKVCQHCGSDFMPQRLMAKVCSPICATRLVKAEKKAEKIKNSQERAQFKARKEKLKTWSDHHADAQKAVNAMVRARDAGEPCISCNTPWEPTFQAGHYRSRGAAKNLALDPRNINGQCVRCNLHRHGNGIDYRLGLIARYGVEFVEAIEADNEPRHHSIDDLKAIRAEALGKTKELRKA
jgi:hypothetical protein